MLVSRYFWTIYFFPFDPSPRLQEAPRACSVEGARSRRWSARKIHDSWAQRSCECPSVDRSVRYQNTKPQTSLAESLNRLKMTHDTQTLLLHFPYHEFLFIFRGLIFAYVKYLICVTIVMIARLRSYRELLLAKVFELI